MAYRIYIDEAGTHSEEWLVMGVLFVPDHGALHSALCQAKESIGYFNTSPKSSARYKETHLAKFRSPRDVAVARAWIDAFFAQGCFYRSIVIDMSKWDGSYFGHSFDPEALKKRRAYKKWLEMLLHPELKGMTTGAPIYGARLYLDRLISVKKYDVLDEIEERFTRNYQGVSPHIDQYQHTDSSADANQCLQLCDLLTGCVYQSVVPASAGSEKVQTRDYLATKLASFGVQPFSMSFWKGYHKGTLTKHFPKFSVWYWRPE